MIAIDSHAAYANYHYGHPWGAALQGAAVLSSLVNLGVYVNEKKMYRNVHSYLKATAIGIALVQKDKDQSLRSNLLSIFTLPFEWVLTD